ncbi:beta-taxilin isoform X2 [Silurus asotus]|uniref:Beta-taxilin isoform X2 n=1 Tax=Silurus asotus TaxID=30991 RepID=A0AAD5B2C9_SILAS|nr:beta-taxilin isoform X2 [Silurus asotus]
MDGFIDSLDRSCLADDVYNERFGSYGIGLSANEALYRPRAEQIPTRTETKCCLGKLKKPPGFFITRVALRSGQTAAINLSSTSDRRPDCMMEKNPPPSTDATDQVSGLEEKPVDPMEVFSRQLEDIINTYGSACSLMEEKIAILEKDEERLDEADKAKDSAVNPGVNGNPETEQVSGVLLEELGKDASPEEKLETVLRKYAKLLKEQMSMQDLLKLLQEKQGVLVKQRDQLQIEHSQGILARSRLESLCRELHKHNMTLKEEMLHKCQEDEKKRAEITSHFQTTVVDIQAQIEHHSNRNNKLCHENNELANKLTSIIQQYEKREESLEKLFKQKSLQQQLSDTKLEEANLALKEAGEKHMREKEYLLKDAIEKTKKCFTLKEQELQMKKQLLSHAAEWKLQVKELKEQNTVMQAQLVLYSQKFDEFQTTLAKSNEVYVAFKQEMEKMSKKMKKLEKESNVWKIRFESCNKALTDMIEERSEKGKELEMFTVKIDKLETLCRALQEERKVLYEKIKDIRLQTISASEAVAIIVEEEIPELNQLAISEPERNPALTSEMEKLWKEQARLEEFAASLIASTSDDMEGSDSEEEPSEPVHPIPVVPVPNKTSTVEFTEECGVDQDRKEVHKEVVQLEANQQEKKQPIEEASKAEPPKAEPPKAEPPKIEPPKAESPKAQPSKEEPPEAETPKGEPSKVESSQLKPKVEPPKVEPPKAESHKLESPKEESPNVEPPKVEPSKAEPPKVEPSKAEPFKVDPPKAEPSKAESPKVEPSKAEQSQVEPKIEPPKEEPPNRELPKAEPPQVEPSIAEPIKAEFQKAEPPKKQQAKQEPPKKQQQSKAEPPKEVLTKGPSKKMAKPEGNKQHTPKQKPNRPNSVEIKEPKSKEVKPPTVSAQAPEEPSHKNELLPEKEPMADSGKESQPIQVESPVTEPSAHEVSTGASGSQNPKPSQEATPTSVNKPHPKKQGGAKKKGAPKSVKKS